MNARKKIVFLAASGALALGLAASVAPTATASVTDSWHGCPSGAVCIYPQDAGWNNDHPSNVYYSYGAHNLSNQNGNHYVSNNQTGGASMRTCTGYDGQGCQGYLLAGTYMIKDLTPINSITLQP
ncbi:hypothetical protein [Streptomyces sp. G-G2]|uniref:hypothetical protein n=1 Tax=Streptomyces sp. G-G2 TaxID=3046201 RepID=UPI0024BB48D2|nr:hypothetical protein [Streptomyces sp. G-G2]MDJ0385170.1 hypothetical protein [Streptomyces sp. G-G2]